MTRHFPALALLALISPMLMADCHVGLEQARNEFTGLKDLTEGVSAALAREGFTQIHHQTQDLSRDTGLLAGCRIGDWGIEGTYTEMAYSGQINGYMGVGPFNGAPVNGGTFFARTDTRLQVNTISALRHLQVTPRVSVFAQGGAGWWRLENTIVEQSTVSGRPIANAHSEVNESSTGISPLLGAGLEFREGHFFARVFARQLFDIGTGIVMADGHGVSKSDLRSVGFAAGLRF